MFWRRATSVACLLSMSLAAVVTLLWPLLGTAIDPVFPGIITSLALLIGVSLITDHTAEESVKAVYWENLPTAESRLPSDESTNP